MSNQEFSDLFDTMLNSYANQAQFGEQASKTEIALDEYEKSVFLTHAQDMVVKSFFDRKKNATGDGFDDNTERQIDFSSLIKTADAQRAEDQSNTFDDRGIIYTMPMDILFILNEKLVCTIGNFNRNYVIVPLNYKEYDREMSKPYSQPLKRQAWRLFQNKTCGFDLQSELIPRWNLTEKETISAYKIRYVRRPTPIILVDLPNGMEIDGCSDEMECELNPILHPEIIQRAVELAYASRGRVSRDADNQ
jgi:hypothetical protein